MKIEKKVYISTKEKKRDFWIGFFTWYGMNIPLAIITSLAIYFLSNPYESFFNLARPTHTTSYILQLIFFLLPWVINLGLIIYFSIARAQLALGMLAAFGFLIILAICAGVIFTIWCFLQGSMNI